MWCMIIEPPFLQIPGSVLRSESYVWPCDFALDCSSDLSVTLYDPMVVEEYTLCPSTPERDTSPDANSGSPATIRKEFQSAFHGTVHANSRAVATLLILDRSDC